MMDLRGLAYVVAETTDIAKWTTFAQDVLGMMAQPSADGGLRVKMDERQFRIAVQPGSADRYVASAWEVLDAAAFEAAVATLRKANVDHALADAAACESRGVQQLVSFADPSGNRHEVVWGFRSDFKRFASPVGVPGFVTTDGKASLGMGHTVLPAPNFEATTRFLREVMGFGLSDLFNFKPPGTEGVVLPIHFFHCNNGRHHSLAVAGFPVESGCVHVMVEVDNLPEVGRAIDRMRAHQVQQMATLGQHTNDRMVSFYLRAPSNFDIEYGCGGAVMDWQQHIVHEFTEVSLWGHDFSVSQQTLLNKP
jgi:3,4-dihydroxy-9,10-secoandrosta-1,3,5(10)-triene-9,17-dione 4,5-dioxygenase